MMHAGVQISHNTEILRSRVMPVDGKLFVRKGEIIKSTDIIAQSNISPEFYSLDIARGLGVSRNEIKRYFQFGKNEIIKEGRILAGPVGFTKRVVRAPRSGKIVDFEDGIVLIQTRGNLSRLIAGLSGKVDELIPRRGAVIRSQGAAIQGVWGNGRINSGELAVVSDEQVLEIQVGDLKSDLRNKVVVAGHCGEKEFIKNAAQLPVVGLILFSASPQIIPLLSTAPFAVVVLEGFRECKVNSLAENIIQTHLGCRAEINAQKLSRMTGVRPEVVIPKTCQFMESSQVREEIYFPGQMVKILSFQHMGEIGRIVKSTGVRKLPNGIFTSAVEVEKEDSSCILVPINNLELIIQR